MPRRSAALSGLLRPAHARNLRQPAVAGGARHRLEQPRAPVVSQYAPDDVPQNPVNAAGADPNRGDMMMKFLLSGLTLSCAAVAASPALADAPKRVNVVAGNGASIEVLDQGTGPALVLLP